ncbi:MAG: CHAP domain-containing protein [Salinibacterium sp.]|nr:CHAP domain-containing protein [Salinibacterium sp.]
MSAVGGMFMVFGLPAYADTSESVSEPTAAVSERDTQTLAVSASATGLVASRDAFTATTPEELAVQRAEAARAAAAASYTYTYRDPGPRQAGDDYPFRGEGGLSPLRYYAGECVDFVAWRLNRDAGFTGAPWRWTWSNLTPGGGSAVSWRSQWESHGWPVSSTPVAGAVALTDYDHVAYVKEVYGDGSVLVEEYNYGSYHAYGQRVLSAGSVIAFLYPPS